MIINIRSQLFTFASWALSPEKVKFSFQHIPMGSIKLLNRLAKYFYSKSQIRFKLQFPVGSLARVMCWGTTSTMTKKPCDNILSNTRGSCKYVLLTHWRASGVPTATILISPSCKKGWDLQSHFETHHITSNYYRHRPENKKTRS